jgi:hypothetical protein
VRAAVEGRTSDYPERVVAVHDWSWMTTQRRVLFLLASSRRHPGSACGIVRKEPADTTQTWRRDRLNCHRRGRPSVGIMVASWISPKARKGISSDIAGRGLFATEPIGASEIVAVKGGHIVTTTQLRQLPDPLPNSEIQIADGLHLVALSPEEYDPVMLFINHSCEPNVGLAGNIVLITMREVTAGEELTTDYALFDDYDGRMPCDCNTASCRRVIDGHDWRRSDLQRRYYGYFSWYLQRKITAMHARGDRA